MKRTTIDFSKHEVFVSKSDNCTIHHIRQPNTIVHNVKFINAGGILSVTGDLGNWIFCRSFLPYAESDKVSGSYWDEKLQIGSVQKSDHYCPDKTLSLIQEFEEYYTAQENEASILEELNEYIHSMRQSADHEWEYVNVAYTERPDWLDAESVPFGKVRHHRLNIIYDAYDEIIDRYKAGLIKEEK